MSLHLTLCLGLTCALAVVSAGKHEAKSSCIMEEDDEGLAVNMLQKEMQQRRQKETEKRGDAGYSYDGFSKRTPLTASTNPSNQNAELPPSEEFMPRLQQSIHSSDVLADPCSAQKMLRHFYWNGGTGSILVTLTASIILGASQNPPLSMAYCGVPAAEQSDFYNGMWSTNFENGLGIPVCGSCYTSAEAATPETQDLLWMDEMHKKWPVEMDRWRRAVLTKFFTLQEHTSKHVDQTTAALALDHEDYIGVHIRHGDKGSEANLLKTQVYANVAEPFTHPFEQKSTQMLETHARREMIAQKVKTAVELSNITNVFLASDDADTMQEMQNALPHVTVKMAPRVDQRFYESSFSKNSSSAELALLTDLVILQRSKVFIGTGSSNLGRAVWTLRGEEEQQHDISCDDPFDEDWGGLLAPEKQATLRANLHSGSN